MLNSKKHWIGQKYVQSHCKSLGYEECFITLTFKGFSVCEQSHFSKYQYPMLFLEFNYHFYKKKQQITQLPIQPLYLHHPLPFLTGQTSDLFSLIHTLEGPRYWPCAVDSIFTFNSLIFPNLFLMWTKPLTTSSGPAVRLSQSAFLSSMLRT